MTGRNITLVLACALFAVIAAAAHGKSDSPAAQREALMDAALTTAVSGARDSLANLRRMREQANDSTVRDFIDAILSRWDAAMRTYISARPIQVERECLHLTANDRHTIGAATQIAFNIKVDERGRPLLVSRLGISTNDRKLAERVEESIAHQRFVPAHDARGFKPGTLTITCRIEVR